MNPRLDRSLQRLAKWRSVFAGWQLGTRPETDGPTRAVRDHREATMLLRAEVTALTGVLIEKGVMTAEDLDRHLEQEAVALEHAYRLRFPGFEATDDGMALTLPEAHETMEREGFPP